MLAASASDMADKEEYFDLVDEDDRVVGRELRSVVHRKGENMLVGWWAQIDGMEGGLGQESRGCDGALCPRRVRELRLSGQPLPRPPRCARSPSALPVWCCCC